MGYERKGASSTIKTLGPAKNLIVAFGRRRFSLPPMRLVTSNPRR